MENKQINTSRISQNVIAAIGAVIVLIGGFFLSYNFIQSKKIIAYDYMANAFYDGTKVEFIEEEEQKEELEEVALPDEVTNDYIGYLNNGERNGFRVRAFTRKLFAIKTRC